MLRLVFRSFKPFQRADLADPKVRKGISNFMPDVDLDDPTVQAELRQMTIPSALLDGLRTVGRMAFDNAKALDIPGMVVQGRNDEVVGVENTRRLVERLGNSFQYHEVDADHLLIDKSNAGFPHLQEQILNYLNRTAAIASVSTNGAGFNKDK
jgi:surfactin synthase thioesterase subunit